ncbi:MULTISPECIES: site-2 protease family protein [Streptomyces]|uniref:site-2 protease family protein n=1 Tax=unclassified Streptomyces TaxID=2593676 RepID=UPI00148A0206|nr:site-2 protease family protein [Streptomyces sp. Z423-1]
MDESGGSGQPRPGTDEADRHQPGRTTPTTNPARPDPPRPTDPAAHPGAESPLPDRVPADVPAPEPDPARGARGEQPDGVPGERGNDEQPTGNPDGHGRSEQPDGALGPHVGSERPSEPGDAERPGGGREGLGDGERPRASREGFGDGERAGGGRGDGLGGGERPSGRADDEPPSGDQRPPAHLQQQAPTSHPSHRTLAHSTPDKGTTPQRPPEPRGGLLMGRPFGVPVYVAPSWFLVAALITWVFGGQLERVLPELGAARYLVSLFFAVAFYASVLVHELAHTVAALRYKLPVRRIQLQFFGGVSEIEKEAETPGREFVLAFVGPLLSLVLAGLFYLAMQPVEPGTVPGVLLAGLMISNLIVAVFNLLPGLPLDGGRMLRAVVWKITGKPMSGTVAAAWVGRALAVSVLIGLPLLTQSGALGRDATDNVGMDTVMDALLAAILAAIIWTGAGNSLRVARLREHLPELRARTLTRRAVPVQSDTPLSEALRRANAAGARALVVVDAEGNPLSLVREAAIVGVPEHRRPWVAVSGLAQELTDGMRVSAELAGEDLLEVLRATPATEYLVVEETGAIYGVLSAADVERAFVKAMARPS